ncbi:MAG: YbaN family protein [Pseudoruegeria sp.]
MKYFWALLGLISLALGMIGVILPLLPTVPFLLLAAFCFARSSNRLHQWLIHHPTFGPSILDWNENGAISSKAKRLATISILVAFSLSLFLGVKTVVLIIQATVLVCVLVFIWTRPNS